MAALLMQEASFLLWYHSLDNGGERVAELIAQGLVPACLQVVVDSKAKTPDRTCATGILMTLCSTDKHSGTGACDQVVRSKAGSSTALMLLHELLQSGDNMCSYAAHCLQCIAEEPQARASMIRAMDGRLHFLPLYMSTITQCTNILAASSVASFLVALLKGQRTLVEEALAHGITEAAIYGLRRHKIDHLIRHCADLLAVLLENHASWDRVANCSDLPNAGAASGLRLLVDLLGPPPEAIIRYESLHYGHILHPEKAEQEARKKAEEVQAALQENMQKQNAEGQNNSPRLSFGQRKTMPGGNTTKGAGSKVSTLKLDRQSTAGGSEAAKEKAKVVQVVDAEDSYQETPRDRPEEMPPKTPEQLFSRNVAALQWNSIVSTQTRATVAGCLYMLAQSTEHMHTMSALLATSRLVLLINAIMCPPDEGKNNKKSKPSRKNKLKLSAQDTNSLVNITGALKFLTLVGANCYRVARMGGLKHVVTLYKEASHTLLRRNAQVILANVATVAECGQMLFDAKVPETFLVAVPVRLTPAEVEELLKEFPDAPLDINNAAEGKTAAAS
ncbi:hypothetical protein DUNSADRAFT_14579 [Dunaliella salina]|uniref:Uncharacterized protein n=1 Tax=Dunaliella salina TaxID=3046 RepID=A0ABQ7G746_DUNSA|nr:hypothetical protein DUNSADRAFT_14579 [Dunaliella salina]|eukprot:KAF5830420.1 hypothetical protein DUNSADRAFT_14579 [Dunaliella salina]